MSSKIPSPCTLELTPFKIAVPNPEVADFRALLKLSPLPPVTFEGKDSSRKWGVTRDWMVSAKSRWENEFDWRDVEAKINATGEQYTTTIKAPTGTFKVHFLARFSGDPKAQPLILLHGWPGDFTEYLPAFEELKKSTDPIYDIIIPSVVGYGFSTGPPLDRDFSFVESAEVAHLLMVGLGYKDYIAQGGDTGSIMVRSMTRYPECKGIHLNMYWRFNRPPPPIQGEESEIDRVAASAKLAFETKGLAYSLEHATRPSTISHVLSSSPLALLAWVGEKFLEWTDEDPSVDSILQHATLWWFTKTFPRGIYHYRHISVAGPEVMERFQKETVIQKPFAVSWFPKEILGPTRQELLLDLEDPDYGLVHAGIHHKGGHWPGFEAPKELAEDIKGLVRKLDGKKQVAASDA